MMMMMMIAMTPAHSLRLVEEVVGAVAVFVEEKRWIVVVVLEVVAWRVMAMKMQQQHQRRLAAVVAAAAVAEPRLVARSIGSLELKWRCVDLTWPLHRLWVEGDSNRRCPALVSRAVLATRSDRAARQCSWLLASDSAAAVAVASSNERVL